VRYPTATRLVILFRVWNVGTPKELLKERVLKAAAGLLAASGLLG